MSLEEQGAYELLESRIRTILPEEYQELVATKRDRYFVAVQGLVTDGIAAGEIATSNPALTALAVHGMANWTYQWYRNEGGLSSQQIAQHMWDLIIFGIGTLSLRKNRSARFPLPTVGTKPGIV